MTKDEALKLALEAMTYADACLKKQLTTKDKHEYAQDLLLEAGTAIKETLAQPEQEPVAWMNDSTPSGIFARHIDGAKNFGCTIPLYITPPQRTWVGLTDEDLEAEFGFIDELLRDTCYRTEAKLKEKNT